MAKLYEGKTDDEVLAIANSLEMCKWCNGSGSDGLSAPIHHCPDCGSTGYKDGPAAERIIDLAFEVQHDRGCIGGILSV